MKQIFIRDIGVYPFISRGEIIDYIDNNKGVLIAINAEKVIHATDDTKALINRNVGYCDGAGVQIALKRKGHQNAVKIPGCELWLDIVDQFNGAQDVHNNDHCSSDIRRYHLYR